MGEIMEFFKHKPEIKILESYTHTYGYIKSCIIISVENGKGALTLKDIDNKLGSTRYKTEKALCLNNVPIVHINSSVCPTCAGLLSVGYGIDNVCSTELLEISGKINQDFVSLEKTAKEIEPLLGLLKSGVYMIADMDVYPTDGDGNFFWNIPIEMKEYSAFCGMYYLPELITCSSIDPIFIYPTQSPEKYNEACVKNYIRRFSKSKNPPRAIAYNSMYGISTLLDGHHKACAAAIMGIPLKCLVIIPPTILFESCSRNDTVCKINWNSYHERKLDSLDISDSMKKYLAKEYYKNASLADTDKHKQYIPRQWEQIYIDSAMHYPTAYDAALENEFGIDTAAITEEMIDHCYSAVKSQQFVSERSFNGEEYITAKRAILIMRKAARLNHPKTRDIALNFATIPKHIKNQEIIETALEILLNFKDSEVEQVFIDILVNSNNMNDSFAEIAKKYWD